MCKALWPVAALLVTACDQSTLVAVGPYTLKRVSLPVVFQGPVPVQGPVRELCFRFDPPGGSREAYRIRAALITSAGRPDTLRATDYDRRGENTVCLVDRSPDSAGSRLRGTLYQGALLWADTTVTITEVRWWSGG